MNPIIWRILKSARKSFNACKYIFRDMKASMHYIHTCGNKKYDEEVAYFHIMQQTHRIEKGLSLSEPTSGFGYEKICDIFRCMDHCRAKAYPIEHPVIMRAVDTISAYLDYHAQIGFENDEMADIRKRFSVWKKTVTHPSLEEPASTELLRKLLHWRFAVLPLVIVKQQ